MKFTKTVNLKKLTLFGLFLLTFLVIIIFHFQETILDQFRFLVLMAVVYLIWAISHHLTDKSLKLEVAVEYLLIALLVFIILSGLV